MPRATPARGLPLVTAGRRRKDLKSSGPQQLVVQSDVRSRFRREVVFGGRWARHCLPGRHTVPPGAPGPEARELSHSGLFAPRRPPQEAPCQRHQALNIPFLKGTWGDSSKEQQTHLKQANSLVFHLIQQVSKNKTPHETGVSISWYL